MNSYKKFVCWFAFLLLYSNLLWAKELPIPAELVSEVNQSEKVGAALFKVFSNTKPLTSPTLLNAQRTAEAANIERCNAPYRTIVVPPNNVKEPIHVYLIGVPSQMLGIMGGRHFHIEVSNDGGSVLSVAPSTKTCLFISANSVPDGKNPVASYMTHILSSAPSEFHVFLSLYNKKPIFVGTNTGVWKIDNGNVLYVGNAQ